MGTGPADFSESEWSVLHAMEAIDRRGEYPSPARVVAACPTMTPKRVRQIRTEMLAGGHVAPTARAAAGDDEVVPVAINSKRFNMAMYKLATGKGSAMAELGIVTGLGREAIKQRLKRVRRQVEGHPPRG